MTEKSVDYNKVNKNGYLWLLWFSISKYFSLRATLSVVGIKRNFKWIDPTNKGVMIVYFTMTGKKSSHSEMFLIKSRWMSTIREILTESHPLNFTCHLQMVFYQQNIQQGFLLTRFLLFYLLQGIIGLRLMSCSKNCNDC